MMRRSGPEAIRAGVGGADAELWLLPWKVPMGARQQASISDWGTTVTVADDSGWADVIARLLTKLASLEVIQCLRPTTLLSSSAKTNQERMVGCERPVGLRCCLRQCRPIVVVGGDGSPEYTSRGGMLVSFGARREGEDLPLWGAQPTCSVEEAAGTAGVPFWASAAVGGGTSALCAKPMPTQIQARPMARDAGDVERWDMLLHGCLSDPACHRFGRSIMGQKGRRWDEVLQNT